MNVKYIAKFEMDDVAPDDEIVSASTKYNRKSLQFYIL